MLIKHTPSYSSLATIAARAMATLSLEGRKQAEAHVTRAERLMGDALCGLSRWRIVGSDELWVRAGDLAVVMEVDTSAVAHTIRASLDRGELLPSDIRKNVTDNDLDTSIVSNPHDSKSGVTTSPRGVTLLSERGVLLLVMNCRGERGVRFRTGFEAALSFAAEAERFILSLVLAEQEARTRAPVTPVVVDREHPNLMDQAHRTIQAMLAAGRKRIPRALMDQALGKAPVAITHVARVSNLRLLSDVSRPPAPTEPDWPAGFSLNTSNMADAMGSSWDRIKKLLRQTGMYEDSAWHLTGEAWVATGTGALRKEARHRFKAGAPLELQRRLNPLFT